MRDIAVVGTGYVGLTTGACLAHLGHRVVCADIDADKVERLRAGAIPIVEAGLDEIVAHAVADDRLRFVVGAEAAAGKRLLVRLDGDEASTPTPTPRCDARLAAG